MVIFGLKVYLKILNHVMNVRSYYFQDKIVHFRKKLDLQKSASVIIAAHLFMNPVSHIQNSTVNSLHQPNNRSSICGTFLSLSFI